MEVSSLGLARLTFNRRPIYCGCCSCLFARFSRIFFFTDGRNLRLQYLGRNRPNLALKIFSGCVSLLIVAATFSTCFCKTPIGGLQAANRYRPQTLATPCGYLHGMAQLWCIPVFVSTALQRGFQGFVRIFAGGRYESRRHYFLWPGLSLVQDGLPRDAPNVVFSSKFWTWPAALSVHLAVRLSDDNTSFQSLSTTISLGLFFCLPPTGFIG